MRFPAHGALARPPAFVATLALLLAAAACGPEPAGPMPGPDATQGAAPSPRGAATAPDGALVIVLDALAAAHVSAYGGALATTPHLDRWSRRAVLFEDVVSQASTTLPSAWSYLSGRYPPIPRGDDPLALGEGDPSLAAAFRARGHRTAAFTENPFLVPELGFDRGFDLFERRRPLADPAGDGRGGSTEALVEGARGFIRAQAAGRWFAYVHLLRPHNPYAAEMPHGALFEPDLAPPPPGREAAILSRWGESARGGRPLEALEIAALGRMYAGNLACVDALVARLLRDLPAHTRVAVASDHGEAFFEHGHLLHGGTVHAEMVRVPLVVGPLPGGPRLVPAGAELVDLFATLRELFDLEVPLTDGRSLLGLLEPGAADGERIRHATTSVSGRTALALRTGELALLLPVAPGSRALGPPQLFDVVRDPGELRDLSAERAAPDALMAHAREYVARLPEAHGSLPPGASQELRALGYVD